MRTPTYWKDKNIISSLLLPLGWLYGLATAVRLALTKPQKVKAKVICIGNITAGGTGKTPVSVAMAALLKQNGLNPGLSPEDTAEPCRILSSTRLNILLPKSEMNRCC